MQYTSTKLVTFLAILAFSLGCVSPVFAGWAKEALLLQEQLDVNNSFNETLWVGTHNSYNSNDWDGVAYIDPNQTLTPKEQLRSGARELTYDIHHQLGQLLLCHGSPCGGQEKKFRDGLRQIRDFIDEGNQNSVILLKLELEDFFGQTALQLEDILGDYIYIPDSGMVQDNDTCSDRYGLEPEYLTKADVLKAGKNVVVVYAAGSLDECPPSSLFRNYVHVGLEYQVEGWSKKFSKPSDTTECAELHAQGMMTRIHDGNTWLNIGGGGADQSFTGSGDVRQYMRCGLNILEFFNYDGDSSLGFYDPKPKHLVWSWDENEPSGTGDCAAMSSDSVRFRDESCSQSYRFACYSEAADDWRLTSASGVWSEGEQTCSDEHGAEGYVFAVPTNAPQMYALELLMTSGSVWVDYHDLSVEGVWQANNDVRLTVHDQYGEYGGTGGSEFDDSFMIERSLYTGDLLTIQGVRINSGARVDGFEVTYSDGTTTQYGGTGGSWSNTLWLTGDEHIELWDVCVDSHSGSDRIFYFALQTNLGQRVSGGTGATGTCTWRFVDHPIYGFYGKAGEELDSIGFYTVDVTNDGNVESQVIHDEFGEFGGDGGLDFSNRYFLENGISADDLPQIVYLRINAGSRVDGFDVTYTDGTTFSYGGDGGSWTSLELNLEAGEHINLFDVCVDKTNGSDRIFYLKFQTNLGNKVSGGTGSGDCTWKFLDHPIYGFYGRAGNELDSIGFYTVEDLESP